MENSINKKKSINKWLTFDKYVIDKNIKEKKKQFYPFIFLFNCYKNYLDLYTSATHVTNQSVANKFIKIKN